MSATTGTLTKSKLRQAESTESTVNQLDETLVIFKNIIISIACDTLLPSKPWPSVTRIKDFAIQVALVMTGIRSGYLVDTHILRFELLASFLEELHHKAASDLAVCWEGTTQQAFFVNSRLLKSRISLKDFPAWISVAQPISLTSEPTFFSPFLDQITAEVGSIYRLQADNPFDGCPLAAFLLEYPVAYVIETDTLPFLSDVSLCVYECMFDFLGERLTIIKFSIPAEWDKEEISLLLQDKFQQRVGKPIDITRTVSTFDRVAL